jgi:hypothetical protein
VIRILSISVDYETKPVEREDFYEGHYYTAYPIDEKLDASFDIGKMLGGLGMRMGFAGLKIGVGLAEAVYGMPWFFFLRRRSPWNEVLNAHTARRTAFRQPTTHAVTPLPLPCHWVLVLASSRHAIR